MRPEPPPTRRPAGPAADETPSRRLARLGFVLAGALPLGLARAVGTNAGWVLYASRSRFRELTALHIDIAYPGLAAGARRALVRGAVINAGRVLAETPLLWFGSRARLERWFDASPDAMRAVSEAGAGGHGAIFLCPHLGNWEAAGLFVSRLVPMTTLYKPQNHDAGHFSALMREGRERLGARLVPTTTGGVRRLLAALKAGEALGILPDHDPPEGSGVFAPLFGRPAHTMDLVGKLAARSGAPVLFVLAWRAPGGFRFETFAPEPGVDSADPAVATAALNRSIEQLIARHPEQNWWAYKRYRRQPPGVASPYT